MSKQVRLWAIYAAPSILDRVREVPGLTARLIPNAACTVYADEQLVTEVERVSMVCDEPGGPLRRKVSKVQVVSYRSLSGGRSFMPELDTRGDATKRPGFWADAYRRAGDALVEFLTKRPHP